MFQELADFINNPFTEVAVEVPSTATMNFQMIFEVGCRVHPFRTKWTAILEVFNAMFDAMIAKARPGAK